MAAAKPDLCMMFSGGLDTTLAAAKALEEDRFGRLHLLTFCNGYCIRVQSSKIHVDELRQRYGADRICHEISYVTEIFEQLRAPYWPMVRAYRSTLVFDLCCRLSFETAAIIYAVNHDIHHICDGTNIDQGRLFLEKPAYLRVAKAYFAEHGIDYFSPVYARSGGRAGRMAELRRRGLSAGSKVLERLNISGSLPYQPFCLYGIHTFFFTSWLRNAPLLKWFIARHNLSVEDAVRLRLDRQEIGRRIIRERTGADAGADGRQVQDRFCTTRLCGQNGVEIALPRGAAIDLDALEAAWRGADRLVREQGSVRRRAGRLQVEAFRDGRVLVTGTKDRDQAAACYREHVAPHLPAQRGTAGDAGPAARG